MPRADIFRHFAGEGHQGFLENIKVIIIDRLIGNGRLRESFWQYKLNTRSFYKKLVDKKVVLDCSKS